MPIDVPAPRLLHFKYCAPRPSTNCIVRERLLHRLSECVSSPVTCVIAPPGFGKTTLLCEFHSRLRAGTGYAAWLSLDAGDDDTASLAMYVVSALLEAGIPAGALLEFVRSGIAEASPREVLALALRHLKEGQYPVHLILDDVDKVRSASSLEFLCDLIRGAPSSLHIVISARTRPMLHLGQLRVNGALAEIGLDELRFTVDEAAELFGQQDFPPEQIATLIDGTEGWAAVLMLAWQWNHRRQSHPSNARVASGSAPLMQYLSEEILAGLDDDTAIFLARTSIHGEICGELAYALTGREDSGELLERVADATSLLLPSENNSRWYRHHKVTLDFFRERLRRKHPAEIPHLHRKAAEWFVDHDALPAAIQHAALAQDYHYALRLAEAAGGWRLALRQGTSPLRAILACDSALAASYPKVQLGRIFLLLQEGSITEARASFEILREATGNFSANGHPGVDNTFLFEGRMIDYLLLYFEDRPMAPQEIARFIETLMVTPDIDPLIVAIRENALCCSYLDAGEFEQCRKVGEHVLAAIHGRCIPLAEYYIHVMMGLSLLYQGNLIAAFPCFESARDVAFQFPDAPNVQMAIAEILLAELYYERDDVVQAQRLLDRALPLVETTGGALDFFVSAYSTLVSLAPDETAVFTALDRAERSARGHRLQRLEELMANRRVRELLRFRHTDEALRLWESLPHHDIEDLGTINARDLRIIGTAQMTQARILLANGEPDKALQRLLALEAALECRGLHRMLLDARLLKAACLNQLQQFDAAIIELKQVVSTTAQQHFCRSFLNEASWFYGVFNSKESPFDVLSSLQGFDSHASTAEDDGAEEADSHGEHLGRHHSLLSQREMEVLAYLADGMSNKEVARKLGISEGTVKSYRKNVYRKLGAHNRFGLISKGRSLSLLRSDVQASLVS